MKNWIHLIENNNYNLEIWSEGIRRNITLSDHHFGYLSSLKNTRVLMFYSNLTKKHPITFETIVILTYVLQN